mmetsp:Transcript_10617/g.35194  ORF Transcript_10617/g.35194 Transcript_10617/m.35194 type:complete len:208 (-) Transcript_10617:2157-2780(-)
MIEDFAEFTLKLSESSSGGTSGTVHEPALGDVFCDSRMISVRPAKQYECTCDESISRVSVDLVSSVGTMVRRWFGVSSTTSLSSASVRHHDELRVDGCCLSGFELSPPEIVALVVLLLRLAPLVMSRRPWSLKLFSIFLEPRFNAERPAMMRRAAYDAAAEAPWPRAPRAASFSHQAEPCQLANMACSLRDRGRDSWSARPAPDLTR